MSGHSSVVGTVVFTDLVGFTDYNDARGDAAALEVLESQRSAAEGVLDDVDRARVVKELGDGLMLWFHDAAAAIVRTCRLMESLDRGRRTGTFPLSVRIGAHHGEAAVRGDDLVGRTVNIAARVCALAGPGELLVTDATLGACHPDDRPDGVHAVGPVHVKGVSDPVWLHRVR